VSENDTQNPADGAEHDQAPSGRQVRTQTDGMIALAHEAFELLHDQQGRPVAQPKNQDPSSRWWMTFRA
jgi:hypothetical protein